MARRPLLLAAALALLRVPAAAQTTVGLETAFKGYSFGEGLGPKAAQLFMMPLAVRVPLTSTIQADLGANWAQGKVEREGATYTLSGLTDAQLKASWTAKPWAVVSLSLNLPTGKASHDAQEAVVAAVLSSDLLGFRESSWGTGFALTSGVATATRVGAWGMGLGASYRVANGFEPSVDTKATYQPGNEMRVRLGFDRNVGEAGKLSAGVTLQDFSDDQYDGRNYFQAGKRFMMDGSYAFRVGSQTWTAYGSELWRQNGDLFLSVVDGTGNVLGDSTVTTGSQSLLSFGFVGAIPIGSLYRLRPGADLRLQSRSEQNGSDEGSGWVLGAGADFPLRLLGTYDIFPKARFTFGSIKGPDGKGHSAHGGELGLTIRWGG